jgi:hypothetical protein
MPGDPTAEPAAAVAPVAAEAPRLFAVRSRPDVKVFPGLAAQITIAGGKAENVLIAPDDSRSRARLKPASSGSCCPTAPPKSVW